jgi:hypothetical protein
MTKLISPYQPIPVGAAHAAASFLMRDWGEEGYRIGGGEAIGSYQTADDRPVTVYGFEASHRDGSWVIAADKWGNVASADTAREALAKLESKTNAAWVNLTIDQMARGGVGGFKL